MTPERIEEFRKRHRLNIDEFYRGERPKLLIDNAELEAICDLALDGLRLRQGKVLNLMGKVKNWNHENKIYWIPRGKLLVLVDKGEK